MTIAAPSRLRRAREVALPEWRRRALARRLGMTAVNLVIAFVALFPIVWGLSSSLKPPDQIVEYPPRLFPTTPTLEHYVRIFRDNAGYFIMNSTIISVGAVALSLAAGALAAYAMARFEFRGRQASLVVIVAIMSIPIASLLVPTFTLLSTIGLLDTRLGLVLLYTAYQLPIVVWMLYGYFLTLPIEIEHAARIDGCSPLRTLWKVVLPLSRPALIAAALFVVVFSWNDFVVAVTMTSTERARTLPVAIYFYLGFYGREWGPLLAASIVSIVPIIAVFVFLQRYFVAGMTGGSVKG
jgi:multiple sugar transport system permease protein